MKTRRVPVIKAPLLTTDKLSRRSEVESVERRTFPDPGNNLDDEDKMIEKFDNPGLMTKWITRAHGNNELSASMFRYYHYSFV